MRRPQKTRKLGYHQRASVEHEGYDEVRSTSCGEQRKQDGVENLFGRILERNNLNQAYLQVVRKRLIKSKLQKNHLNQYFHFEYMYLKWKVLISKIVKPVS